MCPRRRFFALNYEVKTSDNKSNNREMRGRGGKDAQTGSRWKLGQISAHVVTGTGGETLKGEMKIRLLELVFPGISFLQGFVFPFYIYVEQPKINEKERKKDTRQSFKRTGTTLLTRVNNILIIIVSPQGLCDSRRGICWCNLLSTGLLVDE